MIEFDYDEQCNLQVNFQEKLPLDDGSRFHFLSQFSKIFNKFEPLDKWINDEGTPQEQKLQYQPVYANAIAGLNFIHGLAKVVCITDEELKEYTKIPF